MRTTIMDTIKLSLNRNKPRPYSGLGRGLNQNLLLKNA
jgi:hypothetical protein